VPAATLASHHRWLLSDMNSLPWSDAAHVAISRGSTVWGATLGDHGVASFCDDVASPGREPVPEPLKGLLQEIR